MFTPFNQSSLRSLVLNLLLSLGLVLLMNGLIFSFGWGTGSTTHSKPWFNPPDYLVGLVWTGLFALMAIARWMMNFPSKTSPAQARNWITLLIGFCLLYPLYSLALNSFIGGLIGNLATIVFASFTIVRVWSISQLASVLIMPVVLWVAIATTIDIPRIQWLSPITIGD